MSMESSYDTRAEYHEVHMPTVWDRLRAVVSDTFGDIGLEGVIVDVGAGSGLGSAMIAEITDAEIIALEPSTTMRAMMVARLDTAGVLERVTVIPEPVPQGLAGLPERVDGVIVAHMLGHLAGAERIELLEWIAASLRPGRTALLTVSAEAPPDGTEPVVQERTVGRFVYRATSHMPGPGRFEGLFEVIDQEQRVVLSLDDATSWEAVTVADIQAATAGHPVEVTEPQPGVVLVSRSAAS